MSNHACERCGALCLDSQYGYYTGCAHYPPDFVPDQCIECEAYIIVYDKDEPRSCEECGGVHERVKL